MALVKCKECGRDISTKAKICPGCGLSFPINAPDKLIVAHGKGEGFFLRSLNCGCMAITFITFSVAALVVLFIIMMAFIDKKDAPRQVRRPEISDLPKHVVFQRSKVGLDGSEGVYIKLFEADPKRKDCLALINYYRVEAQPNGLVSIQVKHEGESEFWPMAWDNLDGTGIHYFDQEPSEAPWERLTESAGSHQSNADTGNLKSTETAGQAYFDSELPLVCYVAEKNMPVNDNFKAAIVVNLQSRYTMEACGLVVEKYKNLTGPGGSISIRIKNSTGWELAAFDGMDGRGVRYLIDPK